MLSATKMLLQLGWIFMTTAGIRCNARFELQPRFNQNRDMMEPISDLSERGHTSSLAKLNFAHLLQAGAVWQWSLQKRVLPRIFAKVHSKRSVLPWTFPSLTPTA